MTSAARPGSLVPPRINTTTSIINGGGSIFPGAAHPDGPHVESCDRVDTHYDVAVAVVFTISLVVGILYTFCGYRCFKTIMFLTGFIFASSIVYLICSEQKEFLPTYGDAGVALLAGILFGLITTLVQYVGLFMNGLHTGILMGLASLLIADHCMITSPKGSVWLCVAVLLCSGLLLAILNLYFRKGLTVLGSCVYGGAMLSAAIDYFVEKLSMVSWVWQRVTLRPVQPPPCWFSWIVLGVWPSFVFAGILIQCCLTGRGMHHEDLAAGRKKPRGTSVRGVTKADRQEMRQKKYRYLYQVRTAHGDVISQDFVQQLQKKENGDLNSGECSSTLQSDATHLTILPDAQLAALTESEDDSHTEITTARR